MRSALAAWHDDDDDDDINLERHEVHFEQRLDLYLVIILLCVENAIWHKYVVSTSCNTLTCFSDMNGYREAILSQHFGSSCRLNLIFVGVYF